MDAVELILVAVWAFAVAFFGGLVGLVLGNLRLPLIVLVASSPAAGAGANVAISGAAALTAAYSHWRGGRIDWRLFGWMAPTSLIGAVLGGLLSGVLPDRALLGTIAVVVLYSAVDLLRRDHSDRAPPTRGRRDMIVNAALIGFAVGVLGGIVGLILGSLRLPAMVRFSGVSVYGAVGTNAAVGVIVGIGGLVGHLPSGIDWPLLAVGAAASMPAAYLGARLTGRLDEGRLLQAIGAILIVAGSAMAIQAIVG